jgi:energy-coupling factor transporter ATP-binding protein EcfA2
VADKLIELINQHGRQVDTADLKAAIQAVRDTFELASLSPRSLMQADLDGRTLERNMDPFRAEILEGALLGEAGQQFYSFVLRESCSYAVEFVSTLPSYDVSAFAEILRRDTLILATLQEVLAKLPDRESTDDFTADYRRQVIQRLNRMQLFGAKLQSDYGRRYPLSVAYVSLGAASQRLDDDVWLQSLGRVVESAQPEADPPVSTVFAREEAGAGSPDARELERWVIRWGGWRSFLGTDFDERAYRANSSGTVPFTTALGSVGKGKSLLLPLLNGMRDLQVRSPAAGDVPVEEWLASNDEVLLIGEAGSGKSTLLQWLAVRAARGDFAGRLERWNAHIPFYIPLRRYAADGPPPPEKFPLSVGANIIDSMPKGWVHSCLKNGKGLILVDGLDELKEGGARERAIEWLEQLVEDFPDCTYIITSRPGAVAAQGRLRSRFMLLELRPMTPVKIRGFVEHWHEAMRVELTDHEEREKLSTDQSALLATLETDRYIRALCVNPLLCALICALNRERHGNLPKDRMGVYRGALEMLLDMRDRERRISPGLNLSQRAKTTLLQDLALYLVRNAWSDAPVERVREQIVRTTKTLNEVTADSPEVLQFLIERSGLIRMPAEGRVDFIHRSFQEYLAGKAAIDGDEIGYLLQHATDDQFRDVIVMAAGHALPPQAEELLRGLVEKIGQDSGKRGFADGEQVHQQLKLLAIACLQTVHQLDPELRGQIEVMAQDLLPPESVDSAPVLASIGPLVLDLMAERAPITPAQAVATIRVATLVGGRDAILLISDVVGNFDEVEDEVIRAWTEFDVSEYAETVLPRLRWSGRLSVTDATLLPYLGGMSGLKELTVPVNLLQYSTFPATKPDDLYLLRVTGDAMSVLADLQGWDELPGLEVQLDKPAAKLATFQKFRKLQQLAITSQDPAVIDLTPLSRLQNLTKLHLRFPAAKMIRLHPLSKMRNLTVYVPPNVAIVGREALTGKSRVVILGEGDSPPVATDYPM